MGDSGGNAICDKYNLYWHTLGCVRGDRPSTPQYFIIWVGGYNQYRVVHILQRISSM
jgi:hypothetical protein